jgi:hypothetical protein
MAIAAVYSGTADSILRKKPLINDAVSPLPGSNIRNEPPTNTPSITAAAIKDKITDVITFAIYSLLLGTPKLTVFLSVFSLISSLVVVLTNIIIINTGDIRTLSPISIIPCTVIKEFAEKIILNMKKTVVPIVA